MPPSPQCYEIVDGVRRAKALQIAGFQTVKAEVYLSIGRLIKSVDIASLRSPHKDEIDASSSTSSSRYSVRLKTSLSDWHKMMSRRVPQFSVTLTYCVRATDCKISS